MKQNSPFKGLLKVKKWDKSLEALQLSSSHVITDTIHGVCDFITSSSVAV